MKFSNYRLYSVYLCFTTAITLSHAQMDSVEFGTSINPVGSGARVLGWGNAFIAVADDATAASWNPGALLQVQNPEFSIAFEKLYFDESLSSPTHPESGSERNFSLEDLNYASIVLPFYFFQNMVLSLNYFTLYRFDKELNFLVNEPISRRITLNQDGEFSVIASTFGIYVTNRLYAGITFNIWDHSITDSSQFKRTKVEDRISSSISNVIKKEFEVDHGLSYAIGGLYRLHENWRLGLVVKPSFTLDVDQRQKIENVFFGAATRTEFEIDSEFQFPLILGAGVAWQPSDSFTASMDITWTDWSAYTLTENGDEINPVTGSPLSEGRLEDTFTIRTGCEYYLIKEKYLIPLRFGLGYDPGPAVESVDDFYTLNCGTGIQVGSYNLDIGYEFRWGNNVNGSLFQSIDATEDIRQHRILASLIYYF